MFASLGEIVFEVLDSPSGYETRRQSFYAMQRVMQAPARLQWTADDPAEILFDIRLHMSFTNPQLQIIALELALADHIARPLVFGNGDIEGFFALAELETGARQMSSAGDLVCAIVRVRLIEWNYALAGAVGTITSAFGALGAVAAPSGLATAPVAASAAASGAAAPAWATTIGATTSDGSVTWTLVAMHAAPSPMIAHVVVPAFAYTGAGNYSGTWTLTF